MSDALKREQALKDAIESYLDSHPNDSFDGLSEVYQHIGDLCRDKAEHVQSNWQDDALAEIWERFGKACDAAACKFESEKRKID